MRMMGFYMWILHMGNETLKDLQNSGYSTFRAVCFLTISFDLNITADIQIVTKKPASSQK